MSVKFTLFMLLNMVICLIMSKINTNFEAKSKKSILTFKPNQFSQS